MRKIAGSVTAHPWRSLAGLALIVLAGATFFARDLISLALTEDEPIDYTLPLVKPLEARPGEVVYRIDANRSLVTVEVTEKLAGVEKDAVLTTQGIAGDLGVTNGDASSARLSELAVSVHQLESDNNLRDKVLQHEYLESHDHQTVNLVDAVVVDVRQDDGEATATMAIEGDLVVKGESTPVRFEGTAAVDGDTLTATATSTLKMDELGVGPITKVGLVSTGNDIVVTLDIVAVDGRSFTPPTGVSLASVETPADSGPSYEASIEPVLEANCASCHNTGAVGAQMLTLDTAADAAEVADGLAVVTGSGYMPPWPPSDLGVPLEHARGLTPAEIEDVAAWAAAGAPLDVRPSRPIDAPDEPEVPVPDADVVLQMAEPYEGDGSDPDEYRCFLLDPGFTEPTVMTGYQFTPGSLEVVHHVLVYKVTSEARPAAEKRDAEAPGYGYPCGDSRGMGTGGGRLVGGWVPGQTPRDFGEGVGMTFEPGEILVAQIHYHYEGLIRPDRSTMALEVADDPSGLAELRSRPLVGPVELPCPPEDSDGPYCDRDAAIEDLVAREAGSRLLSDGLHRLCGTEPEEVAAASDGWTARTECTYPVRSAGTIVDVLGHMHELGSHYRMTLNKGQPDELVLLDIPVWNFSWQLNYNPVEPIPVDEGDAITVECSWDRSLRFDPEPRYIVFAEGTEDEMCFSTITTLPRDP